MSRWDVACPLQVKRLSEKPSRLAGVSLRRQATTRHFWYFDTRCSEAMPSSSGCS